MGDRKLEKGDGTSGRREVGDVVRGNKGNPTNLLKC